MDKIIAASLFSISGQSLFLDTVIILFASYWEYVVVAALLGYLLLPKRSREEKKEKAKTAGLAILSAAVARLGIVNIVRFFYARPRPFVLEQFTPLIDHAASPAFPSGHAAFFMALAVYFLLAREKKFGWFLLVSAILISLARISAGIHYPTDILAGWVIGALVSLVLWFLVRKRQLGGQTSKL